MTRTLAGLTLAAMISAPAIAADSVKIGFVTTLTTGAGAIGKDMQKASDLALEHIGNKMGGLTVEMIYEDDGFKPEIGKQKTDKLVKQDKVANAGPSQLAGKGCHEDFFSTSWQNDQTPMAMGEVLNQQGVKSIYIMAPNYAAGKNMVSGVERTFKGKILGKDMTKWGKDAQLDFSAELAKAKASGAEGIFVFYPGKAGPAFIKQYEQAGLRGKVPMYSVFSVDALALPRLQKGKLDGVMGAQFTQAWSPDLDNAANKKFVTDFKAKHGSYPSFYAAQAYDAVMLIKSAVDAVNGDLKNKDGMRAAMKAAKYDSVRGKYTYGNNHFPVQNFYLREVVADKDGAWTTKTVKTVFEAHQDTYAKDCKM